MPKNASQSANVEKTLISPRVDLLLGGGLSLVIALIVIVYGSINVTSMDGALIAVGTYLFTDLLINAPHFMASYRVLYSRRDNFRKHPLVTIVAPVLGIGLIAYVGLWSYRNSLTIESGQSGALPFPMIVLNALAPVLLGWHYVGQSWGTTACFASLSGFRMTSTHRRLIRVGFYALFLYHITWGCQAMGLLEAWYPQEDVGIYMMKALMSACRVLVLASFVLGAAGFWLLGKSQQRIVPLKVWLPWCATYSWYVMVDVYPQSFFLLQIFHALQYLMFPARVEMNEHCRDGSMKMHMLLYYLSLVVIGFVVFEWTQILGWTAGGVVPRYFLMMGTATMMVVNVHHYFTDAVIWKIRDPVVRKSVFGHLDAT
ncbi:hypothetical protein [Planctomycetes bacterium K23_9]|uniref:Uncharacterized protein n=1 Tax=Stieleria marina TaxID=1930275 RepID=A0A517NT47_9BACT|nr:hypothetical protein K239x_22560 [Planctomycetes bacterium K23_9]